MGGWSLSVSVRIPPFSKQSIQLILFPLSFLARPSLHPQRPSASLSLGFQHSHSLSHTLQLNQQLLCRSAAPETRRCFVDYCCYCTLYTHTHTHSHVCETHVNITLMTSCLTSLSRLRTPAAALTAPVVTLRLHPESDRRSLVIGL